jgi:hypothetical protein
MSENKQTQERSMATAFASDSKKKLDSIYQIMQEEVPLPSGGALYPSGAAFVTIKPITAKEEDILTNPTLVKSGKAFDMIVDRCIINWNGLTHSQLLAGDKSAIYAAIRILSYGSAYKVQIQCPSCSEKTNTSIDLRTLNQKSLGIAPEVEGENRFKFITPIGHEIMFRLLTVSDLNDISNLNKKKKKNISDIESILLASFISLKANNIMITDKLELKNIIARMPHDEYTAFLMYVNKIKPDIDMTSDVECEHCSEIASVNIPITVEFFWPAASKK